MHRALPNVRDQSAIAGLLRITFRTGRIAVVRARTRTASRPSSSIARGRAACVPRSRTSYGRFAATSPAMSSPMSPPMPGVDRDVLLAVGAGVGHRVADDAGADLELPEHRAVARVDGLEPAVERAVEDDVARRRERAAPHRERLLDPPDLPARRRVPRDELALVAARARPSPARCRRCTACRRCSVTSRASKSMQRLFVGT